MSESGWPAQIDAAKAYEEFFVPALFGEWAPRVAAAARIQTGNHVLGVACGTGVHVLRRDPVRDLYDGS